MIFKRFLNNLLKFVINCIKHRRCEPFVAMESPPIPFLAPEVRTVVIRDSNAQQIDCSYTVFSYHVFNHTIQENQDSDKYHKS